jgi:hypothetical protein
MTRYKVLIVEIDGVDLEVQTELPLDGDRVFFDSTGTGLTASNIQDAITQSLTINNNYSFKEINSIEIQVLSPQQMIVLQELQLLNAGHLDIAGELVILGS